MGRFSNRPGSKPPYPSTPRRGEHRQIARQPWKPERSPIVELQPRPGHQIDDRPRHEDLAGPGRVGERGADVHDRAGAAPRSHSPMCTPARTAMPERAATVATAQPHCTARPGPSNIADQRSAPTSSARPRYQPTSRANTRRRCSASAGRASERTVSTVASTARGSVARARARGSARSRRGSRPGRRRNGRWSSPGSSTNVAPGMRDAR